MFLRNMGGKISFKHASMGLAIFIIVFFLILVALNRPHPPPPPDPKCKDEDTEGGIANEEPAPLPGKPKICIAWEILHRIFGAALMAYRYYPQYK